LTYRKSGTDAKSVADLLNEKLHEMRYFEYLASESNNELLAGGGAEVIDFDTPEMKKKFNDLRDRARKENPDKFKENDYWVSEISVDGDNERKLMAELHSEMEARKAQAKKLGK